MKENLRNSGIDIVGDVSWGTHICQFYQTKEDLTDILVPYFKAGLENNEFCLWITSQPLEVEGVKEALRNAVSDIDFYLEKGQIEIISYIDWFITEGVFDSEKILNAWIEKLIHASESGYDGVRLSGNTFWLEKEDWNSFIEYKERTDNVIGNYRMIALCTYSLDRHNAAEIIDLVVNHQFALIKRGGKWKLVESSKRKKAEEAAFQATKDWEHTFDAVPDLIAIIDTNYRIVRANRAMAARLSLTPEECVGLTCYHVVHGTSEPPSFCPHRQLLKDGFEHTAEVCEDCLGGYFIVSVSPLHDSEGKLTGSIHVARDINERKKAEEKMIISEERFRTLAENSPDVIARFDKQNRHIYANPAAAEPYGRSPEEISGRTHSELGMDPEKVKFWEKHHENVFATGKPETMEFLYKSPQGKEYYFNTQLVPEFIDGKVTSVLAISRNITDLKEAEAKLKELLNNLEDIVEERTRKLENAYKSLEESEGRLAEAQKMANIGNWDLDLVSGKTYWSDEMYRIFGRNPQELGPLYNEFLNYIHPDYRDYVNNALKKGVKREPHSIDYRIVLANGEERTVHMQSEVIFDEENIPFRIKGIVQDITERKRVREKIQILANIVESSNDAIGTMSLDGIITSWNKGAERIYGHSAKKILSKSISILAPPHLDKESKKLSELIKKGERIHNYETLRLRKDGKIIDVSITLSPVFDIHGKLTAISFISRDITERKRAEEKIRESEEKYRNIVETANEGICVMDAEARITYINKKIVEMFGYSHRKIIGRPIWDFISEEGKAILKLNLKKRLQGINESYELELIRKDGSSLWVLINAKSLFDKDGKFMGSLSMLTDINERKHAEEELRHARDELEIRVIERTAELQRSNYELKAEIEKSKKAEKALKKAHDSLEAKVKERTSELEEAYKSLKESEKRLSEAQRIAHIGNWDNDLVIGELYWSDEMYRIFGRNPRESITYDKFLSYVRPEDRDYVYNSTKKAFKGKIYATNYKIVRPDGEERIVQSEREVIFDEKNNPTRMRGTVQDITERKKAEEALVNIENARKKEIHHRIKNNLQVISSLLDLQAEKFNNREDIKDSEVLKAFRESQDRVRSMALIHEELYKGGGIDTLDFSSYIEELAKNLFFTYRLGNTDVSLRMDLKKNIFFDMDTSVPLGIIVNELISNSFKHAFIGKGKGEIRIKLRREENGECINSIEESKNEGYDSTSFTLTVSDNGIGIPENVDIKDLDSLGLQLVTSLVDQLDGELELKRNKGTEFTIRFNVTEKNN
ncbi:MAG: PAS domain S-box protein [Methanosarcina sp.]|nr:hypothetical protein BGV40_05920 [Methanosarcina sp. Ant1]